MNKFWLVIECLYAGKELKNAETWKRFGVLTNIFGVMITSLIGLVPDLYVGDIDKQHIVEGFATLAFIVNMYLFPATSKRIGIKEKTE
jgi:hypothetical protein